MLLCLGWRKGREGSILFCRMWISTLPANKTQWTKHTAIKLRRTMAYTQCQVQSGGSFDIDYRVVGPYERIVLDGSKERQGDFVFTANDQGEYRFCFDNEMSTVTDKVVDFEISVRPTYGRTSPAPPLCRSLARGTRFDNPLVDALRSRTKPAPLCPAVKAPLPNRLPFFPNPSSSSPASLAPFQECKNILGRGRIGISARCGVRSREYSGSAYWRIWPWWLWLGCRCSLCGSSSREHGKVSLSMRIEELQQLTT